MLYRDLGALAGKVVFAAVNVNQYHAKVSDMMAYSREQRLITVPDWHFFAGPVPVLREVWDGYGIAVQATGPDADIVHTSALYFIDPSGRERFIAFPMADHSSSGHPAPRTCRQAWLPPGDRASPSSPGSWLTDYRGRARARPRTPRGQSPRYRPASWSDTVSSPGVSRVRSEKSKSSSRTGAADCRWPAAVPILRPWPECARGRSGRARPRRRARAGRWLRWSRR